MNELKQEDVMRALECCKSYRDLHACVNVCPYFRAELGCDENCTNRMAQDALALLREKDKEIERLQGKVDALFRLNVERDIVADEMLTEEARAEAVREFVERVKKSHDIIDVNGYAIIGVDIVELIAEKMKGANE